MLNKKSFTLIEILIVIVMIGILSGIALPLYNTTKEKMLDKEAKANLLLIQVAEKIRIMETGSYYPSSGSVSVITDINSSLRLKLSTTPLSWSYVINGDAHQATAGRLPSNSRVWTLTFTGDTPSCAGTGCSS